MTVFLVILISLSPCQGHSQRAMAATETGAPIAPAFLKTKRAVAGIFLPETVGFARGSAGLKRERGEGLPEFRAGQ